MPTIRQEISLGINAASHTQLNPNDYDGTVTYYFESTTAVDLKRCSDSTTVVSLGAAGRVSFTPDSGAVNYFASNTESRISIVQSGSWTKTKGAFNLFNNEGGSTSSGTSNIEPSQGIQWWKYESANWDGTTTFTFEALINTNDSMYAASAQLQEDNGSFSGWTDVAASLVSTTNLIRTRLTANFTPTNGRHYRVVFKIANSMTTAQIIKAAILITQTGSPTKQECYAYVRGAGIRTNTDGTGVIPNSQYVWNSNDFASVTAVFYHFMLITVTTSITVVLEDTGGTDVTNSSITSGAITKRVVSSSALTMPASATLQSNMTAATSCTWHGGWIRIIITPPPAAFLHSKITQLNQSVKRSINF